jgi:hypothetical protein
MRSILFTAFPSPKVEDHESTVPDKTPGRTAGHYWRRFRHVNAFAAKTWGKPWIEAGFSQISKAGTVLQPYDSLHQSAAAHVHELSRMQFHGLI